MTATRRQRMMGAVAIPAVNRDGVARAATILLPPPRPTIVSATDIDGAGVLKHGNLYLLSDPLGDVHPDSRGLGLFDLDTRALSCAILRVNGVRTTLVRTQSASSHASAIHLTIPGQGRGSATAQTAGETRALGGSIAVIRRRWINGGLAERIEVTNHSAAKQQVTLDLDLDADAADIFEIRGLVRERRGRYRSIEATAESLVFAYDGLDGLQRRTLVSFSPGEVRSMLGTKAPPDEGSVRIRWVLDVESGASAAVRWEVATELTPLLGHSLPLEATPTRLARAIADPGVADAEYRSWSDRWARIQSDSRLLDLAIERSIADLRLLRNDGPRPGENYIAAGIPWYATLFGRDSIITSLQVLPFMPDIARETLRVLADWQATEEDPERDMEPGKILHELRFGELARTGEVPHRPYYGSVDATPLWLILLDETYRWTGDLEFVRSLWPNALAALSWIDRYGDGDGDGFVEYERRAPAGQLNQGWKDSEDPNRHRDGSLADAPIALVEVQGYVYDAKRRVASLAERLGDVILAKRLTDEAAALQRHFDKAFWMPDAKFYATALDRHKRQVGTISSNPGHCLWSGIVPTERVDAVVGRLLDPSMDGGWGIRTYASGQPGYNPIGYHTGSVWPHDNALIAAGMKRVGRYDAADRITSRLFEAAQHSPDFRLPELFGGFDRAGADMPVPYPVACSPQAWAAATPLSLLQTILGLSADAASGLLELDRPRLPAWLGEVTVHELRVGEGRVDLRFKRAEGDTTSVEVLRRDGPLDLAVRA